MPKRSFTAMRISAIATARSRGAELVTTDADLEGLPDVVFLSKKKS